MTITEPKLEDRAARPYAAIRSRVPVDGVVTVVPHSKEVLDFLRAAGVAPDGPPFFHYLVVDMDGPDGFLEMEVGWPIAEEIAGDGRVASGSLPGGRYAVALHRGHPDALREATRDLLAWAEASGVRWAASEDEKLWDSRLEWYLTDPADEPDMGRWETELAFLTAE